MKGSYPLVPSLPARIQFLSKVSQVVIVVKVKERNQVLEAEKNIHRNQIIQIQLGFNKSEGYRAELDASDAVAQLVKRRRPAHDAHHIGNDQQNPSSDT